MNIIFLKFLGMFLQNIFLFLTSCLTMLSILQNFFKEPEMQFLGNMHFFFLSLSTSCKHFVLLTAPLTRLSIGTPVSVLFAAFSMADLDCRIKPSIPPFYVPVLQHLHRNTSILVCLPVLLCSCLNRT